MPLTNSPGYQAAHEPDSQPQAPKILSRLRLTIFCLALVTILLAGLEFVVPAYGTVRGAVRDLDGHPLQVEVSVTGMEKPFLTDANGRFAIAHVPSGQQILTLGYGGSTIQFQIDVPQESSLNIGQIQIDTST